MLLPLRAVSLSDLLIKKQSQRRESPHFITQNFISLSCSFRGHVVDDVHVILTCQTILNDLTTVGSAIAITSVVAGLGLSGLGAVSEISQLERLAPRHSTLAAGAVRAKKFSGNWPTADLDAALKKFAGNHPLVTTTNSAKRIYAHPETGVQVVEDLNGDYFRINDPSLSGKRTYLDLDGIVPNNKILEGGKQIGRTQSEYNEVTHFNIPGRK